jgi:DHA2 family multidrug resistance protein
MSAITNFPSQLPPSAHITADYVPLRDWIAVCGAVLGAFMAVVDIQIVNGSLRQIEGGLSASLDEGSWITTAYLIAEIVVVPLSGWIANVCSLKRYMMVTVTLFLVFSVCCSFAWDLNSMIVFRALQGFSGGGLIPMAFMIIMNKLPPLKRPIGMALFSVSATMGPSVGPTIGGWLTDNYSWHWIFAVNIVPGIVLFAAIWYGLSSSVPQWRLLRQGDWKGILAMAIGLGALEIVLEEGERNNWFDSDFISRCAVVAVVSLALFVWLELTAKSPFINLRLLKRRNFCIASITNLIFGMGLFGAIFIIPQYLTQMRDTSPLQTGQVLMWIGLPQLIISPLVPMLMRRFDNRLVIVVGMTLFGASLIMNAFMTHDSSMDQFVLSNIVRAIGQPFVMVPLNTLATIGIEKEQSASASGLFRITQDLGGSIGIAGLSTMLFEREKFHSNRLGDAITTANPNTDMWMHKTISYLTAHGINPTAAHASAIALLAQSVRREAYICAYNDDFLWLGLLLLGSCALVCFIHVPAKLSKGAKQ